MLTDAARRAGWALVNCGLWLAAGTAGILAAIHDHPVARVAAVITAMSCTASWAAHTLADHYSEVTDENDMLHGQRHVVFGATEEAEHALLREVPLAAARARARLARSRRRRRSTRAGGGWLAELPDAAR